MPDSPVFDQVNLVVSDMDASIAFYKLLGVDVPDTLPQWQAHHRNAAAGEGVDFDLDSTKFAPHWNQGYKGGPTTVLGFRVATREAVDEAYARLTGAGYRGQQEPWDAFWGARYAIVEDPDGNAVGIMSPRDPERAYMTEAP
jgi:catechol 2,3-dioxygenase-like lactoylglutathione lyase family enzyme